MHLGSNSGGGGGGGALDMSLSIPEPQFAMAGSCTWGGAAPSTQQSRQVSGGVLLPGWGGDVLTPWQFSQPACPLDCDTPSPLMTSLPEQPVGILRGL